MTDYRFSDLSAIPNNYSSNYNLLKTQIRTLHPNAKNHYRLVSDRSNTSVRPQFVGIFDYHCCYCGCLVYNSDFEADHILSLNFSGTNDIDNLSPSCSVCNNLKSDIIDCSRLFNVFNPYTNIANVFNRDNEYRIQIASTYTSDPNVSKFYKVMRFNDKMRRIDYFICSLSDCINIVKNPSIRLKLFDIREELKKYRVRL